MLLCELWLSLAYNKVKEMIVYIICADGKEQNMNKIYQLLWQAGYIYKVVSLSDPIYHELTVVHAFDGTLYLIQMITERTLMSKPGIRSICHSNDTRL